MKKISFIIASMVILALLATGCGTSEDKGMEPVPAGSSGTFVGSGFVGSSALEPVGSGYMDEKEAHLPEEEPEPSRFKTIGTVSQKAGVKRTQLLNLSGKDIIGFVIKSSAEPAFGSSMLETGDVFLLDEIREIYYDPSPVTEPETQAETVTEAQTTQTETTAQGETAAKTETAAQTETTTQAETTTEALTMQAETTTAVPETVDPNLTYDLQITFSDWTVYIIHDLPFDDMELGRICLQNDIPFLEYTSKTTGEEVITRQAEYDIRLAEWQAYQQQLAQQQAYQQQQQQQQQQYAAPAASNEDGCIGDAGLMW